MMRKRKSETTLDLKLYETTKKKASRHSGVELINWVDITITQLGRNLDGYRKYNEEAYLKELKLGLTSMLAVVDEIHDEHVAAHTIL